jgi:hypothetical protein
VGHRGSQVAITRAMASRAVMKLSWKWRSGLERLRVGLSRPSGRGGGETPHTFSNDERVAAQGDRDVVVPAREAAAFVVVQPELALEVFVDALGSPALHHQADELLLGSALWQGDEKVIGRFGLTVSPLNEQPEGFLLALGHTCGDDSTQGKACRQILFGAFAPGAASKAIALVDGCGQLRDAQGFTSRASLFIQQVNCGVGKDSDGVVQSQRAHALTELTGTAIGGIPQHHPWRNTLFHGPPDHLEGQLGLGLESDFGRDARLRAALRAVGPTGGQVQLEVDGQVLGARGDAEADAHLTVGDLACLTSWSLHFESTAKCNNLWCIASTF